MAMTPTGMRSSASWFPRLRFGRLLTPSLFLHNHVGDCTSTDGQRTGAEEASEKAEGDEHVEVAADCTSDGEDDEQCVADMVGD